MKLKLITKIILWNLQIYFKCTYKTQFGWNNTLNIRPVKEFAMLSNVDSNDMCFVVQRLWFIYYLKHLTDNKRVGKELTRLRNANPVSIEKNQSP